MRKNLSKKASALKRSEDLWLSTLLGKPAYKLLLPPTKTAPKSIQIRHALSTGQNGKQAFFYLRIDTRHTAAVHAFEQTGFRTIDVTLQFKWESRLTPQRIHSPFVIRMAEPRDRAQVLDIAGSAFRYSRFHLDPLIPSSTANTIKKKWMDSYFLGRRGDVLWVAEHQSRVIGFLGALCDRSSAVIDLIGVKTSSQMKGVGSALIQHFTKHYHARKRALLVGTQAANVPVVRLYEKMGFRLIESQYVLHAHIHKGGGRS